MFDRAGFGSDLPDPRHATEEAGSIPCKLVRGSSRSLTPDVVSHGTPGHCNSVSRVEEVTDSEGAVLHTLDKRSNETGQPAPETDTTRCQWRSSPVRLRRFSACDLGFYRGAKENRTPDLFHAMEALYQLSYSPEVVSVGRSERSEPANDRRANLAPSAPCSNVTASTGSADMTEGRPALSPPRLGCQSGAMDSDDAFPPDIDADAERFVDEVDEELDAPAAIGPHDGSEADVVDQHRAVPVDDDDE